MERQEQQNEKMRTDSGPHEEFLELCALATAGGLTEEEQRKLREHLATCPWCREAMREFDTVVDQGLPALAPELATEPDDGVGFSQSAAEASFFKRLSEEKKRSQRLVADAEPWLSPLVVRRSRSFRRSFDKYHFWLPLAAGLLLCVSLAILTFRIGRQRGVEIARAEQGTVSAGMQAPQESLEVASRNWEAAEAEVRERNRIISGLRREIGQQSNEIDKLRTQQSEERDRLQASDQEEKQRLIEERDRLAQQLSAGQAALRVSERKLEAFEKERTDDVLHAATLEAKVADLTRALNDQQRNRSDQQELLAKDRDIRELMGARDLYVAEVYDVERKGETEKAFGRVFYTKGKSLIFYAYDLNETPGFRDASTFQAWGWRGPDRTQALNLGMFYEDNASKKRWVLKFNDAKTLQQIDAVFVTVEPHGGSEKPSGKPLLFAYLKLNANHP